VNYERFAELVPVLFGWLLGTLSTLGFDAVRRRRQARETQQVIFHELEDVRQILVRTIILLRPYYSPWDRSLLEWCKLHLCTSSGGQCHDEFIGEIERLLTHPDQVFASAAEYRKPLPYRAPALKTIAMPYLDSQLAQIATLSGTLQRQVIEIKGRVSILNQHIQLTQFYIEKTFDSALSEVNRANIECNLRSSYPQIVDMARDTTDLITRCLGSHSRTPEHPVTSR
jgi:hypothetical protein